MLIDSTDEGCEACALFDIALEEPEGLADIHDLRALKHMLFRLAKRLSADQLLTRIGNSQYPVQLLEFLPHVLGAVQYQLRPVAVILLKNGTEYFDTETLAEFANVYWWAVVNERIFRKEYALAYDEIKQAFRGMVVDRDSPPENTLYYPPKQGEPEDMAASTDAVMRMIDKLYTAMADDGLVAQPSFLRVRHSGRQGLRSRMSEQAPGALFAKGIEDLHPYGDSGASYAGMQVTEIAEYLKKEKAEARENRQAAKAARAKK